MNFFNMVLVFTVQSYPKPASTWVSQQAEQPSHKCFSPRAISSWAAFFKDELF